jgi:hypothetical protein
MHGIDAVLHQIGDLYMFFKRISLLIVSSSIAFTSTAQANTVRDNYVGTVGGFCTISSVGTATTLTSNGNATTIPATTLTGTGTNAIRCNSATAKVSVAVNPARSGYSQPTGVRATESAVFTSGTGNYLNASGANKTSNGAPTNNDSVTVAVSVTANTPNLLVAGSYRIPVQVTLTAN